jgi:soluble lytic murein transglycosylase-like protein
MKKGLFFAAGAFFLFGVFMNREKIIKSTITRFDRYFETYGRLYNIDPEILKKICYVESSLGLNPRVAAGLLNPKAIELSKSYDGLSWGIMQIIPATARQFDPTATAEKLNDPEYSVKIAAQYLNWARSYLKRFISEQDPRFLELWIKSYNQGVGNTRAEIKSGEGYAGAYWTKFQKALA